MDQLKDFLRQCVKYRFWIAFGVSLVLPIVGYFVGAGAINVATTAREKAIKDAKSGITPYTSGTVVNQQYQPIAVQKKDALAKDVDATWRKRYALQEPLLKWPEDVEARFRAWGRKFPANLDKSQVQSTLIDYSLLYPEFVSKVYKTFKPFNPEDGTGIVAAPDEKALLRPAAFSADAPPELGKVWAEQDRLWVVTALLDVVAKVNDSVGAQDWDGAIVKQINLVEVGAQGDQDQKSIVKNQALVPSEPMLPEGTTAPVAVAATSALPGMPGLAGGRSLMAGDASGGGSAAATDEVYYIKTEGKQYKVLPIKMNVLVDQPKIADFLVGLENSPMTIEVTEVELATPASPVVKPAYGEQISFGMGMGMGMGSDGPGMAAGSSMRNMMGNRGNIMSPPGGGGMGDGPMTAMPPGMMGGMGRGANAPSKKGTDTRGLNKAQDRKDKKEKAAAKAKIKTKPDAKARAAQYFNVIELTVYGQARFYLAPPPLPTSTPSSSAATPLAVPKAEVAPAPVPAKAGTTAEKADAARPGVTQPAPTPGADAPKGEVPKAEAPKAEAPRPVTPPGTPTPKS